MTVTGTGALSAQVPATAIVLKFRAYEQVAAARVEPRGTFFGAQVEFATAVPVATTVQLRGPAGTIDLRRQPDGTYEATEDFRDVPELDRRIPDGSYILAVSGPGGGSNTNLTLTTTAEPALTRIVNFDQLQAYPTAMPVVTYVPIAGYVPGDLLGFTVARADGTELYDRVTVGESNIDTVMIGRSLPFGEPLDAVFTYARLSLGEANSGATNVATGSGFALAFPIRCVTTAAVIRTHSRSQVVPIGGTASLMVNHSLAGEAVTYRLLKDGVLVPLLATTASGFERSATFDVPIRQPSDAGVYTIELVNPGGVVSTAPIKVAVVARLDTTLLAGGDQAASVDGVGSAARFDLPRGLAVDAAGNVYATDWRQHTIRKITPNGVVSTVAGSAGQIGSSDGTGAEARFYSPDALAFDPDGNLYVADYGNHTIRRITPAGVVTTIAGSAGQRGSNDGPGTSARFAWPRGLAVDAEGNLFVGDSGNRTVRRVSPAGVVTTVAGRAGGLSDTMVDGAADEARFRSPWALVMDGEGRLYINDAGMALRRMSRSGEVRTIYGRTSPNPRPIAIDTGSGDGHGAGQTTLDAMAVDRSGVIYVAGSGGILRIIEGGPVLMLPLTYKHPVFATDITVRQPRGLGFAADGTLYIAEETKVYQCKLVLGGASLVEIATNPRAQTVPVGESVAFAIEALGPGLCYQWFKEGVGLPGATSATLFLTRVNAADVGRYTVLVGNGAGAVMSTPADLALGAAAEPAQLVNLSLRSTSGAGAQALTVGLVLAGETSGASKNLLVRGIGPTLAEFGVENAMRDPWLTLARSGVSIGTNDNWGGAPTLADTFARAGAFPLTASSRDAALALSLTAGDYTIQLTPTGGVLSGTGVVLAEVYDLGSVGSGAAPRLVNLSTRAPVDGSGALIAGFVVGGGASRTLLIRAMGPSLRAFGVGGLWRTRC